jgi:threonine/homoserine/homoserine lactone efflux protein
MKKIFDRVEEADRGAAQQSHRCAWLLRQGIVVNLLNPKTALFFLAFLPQFVDPSRGGVAAQAALMGTIFTLLGLMTDGAYAIAAGAAGGWIRRAHRGFGWGRFLSGGLFIGLGVSAALSGHRGK